MVSDVLNTSKQHLLFSNSTLTSLKGNLQSSALIYAMPFPVIVWHGANDVLLGYSAKDIMHDLPGYMHTLFLTISGIEIC